MRPWFRLATVLAALWGGAALAQTTLPKPGTVFRDCPQCPDMVVVPPGSFTMGELGHSRETPLHTVTFAKPFAIGVTTVTFDEWDACSADAGCGGSRPNDGGWGRGRHPVVDITWDDAHSYTLWLSRKTGKAYRLPSEAEWEYAARAGTKTAFWWGDSMMPGMANCKGCGNPYDGHGTMPVASFKPNPFGLYDMAGNVTQWVEDHWHSDYDGAPLDGSVWQGGDPKRVVMRSGSWYNYPSVSYAAYRNGDTPRVRNEKIGFRVAVSP